MSSTSHPNFSSTDSEISLPTPLPSPSSSLEHPRTVSLSPVFYRQTTIVPIPTASSPTITSRSAPPYMRLRTEVSTRSEPGEQTMTEVTSRPRTRRRVDARRWTFLLPRLCHWRSQEGAPSAIELGENSSTPASHILPVTGEPIHRTIPLLAARLIRQEDRLDDMLGMMEEIPHEQVEAIENGLGNLVTSHLTLEENCELMNTQLQEASHTINTLGNIATLMQREIESQDDEIDILTNQVTSLARMIENSFTRERARDQTIDTLMTMVRNIQRRVDGAPRGS